MTSFLGFFMIDTSSDLLNGIRSSIYMRILCLSFTKTDSGFCIYHLVVWSNFDFNDQIIISIELFVFLVYICPYTTLIFILPLASFFRLASVVLFPFLFGHFITDYHLLGLPLVKSFLYEGLTSLVLSLYTTWPDNFNLFFFIRPDFVGYFKITCYIVHFHVIYTRNSHYSLRAFVFKYTQFSIASLVQIPSFSCIWLIGHSCEILHSSV